MNWILIAGIVAAVLCVDLCIRLYFARFVLRIFETPLPLHGIPSTPDEDAERVEFSTANGLRLRGSLHWPANGPPQGLVIFCPELNGCHWSATSYCAGPLQNGIAVLSFDFRNHGDSDHEKGYVPLHWLTDRELADVQAAVSYARSRGDLQKLPMAMMGVSRGAGAALAVAAQDAGIDCVAVEGAFSTASLHEFYATRWASMYIPPWLYRWLPRWHINVTLAMSRWMSSIHRRCRYPRLESLLPRLRNRPVLIIAGKRDSYVPIDISQRLAERIGGENCEFWAVPTAKHNRARSACPGLYDAKVYELFSMMLPAEDRVRPLDAEPMEELGDERVAASDHHPLPTGAK